MFTELSLGCLSSGHRNLSMYQVSSSTVFFFVAYTCPLCNVLLGCFPRKNCLNMMMFVESKSFISLPCFMFVSSLLSESRQIKNSEN